MPFLVEICAGGGGAARGIIEAGWDIALSIESDASACQTLSALHGHKVVPRDLRAMSHDRWEGFPEADAWWASPPCQPFAPSGKNLGAEDGRNLWPDLIRMVDLYRPRWLVSENVRGMLNANHRDYTDWLLGELGTRFASVEIHLVDAADYGVPQHRHRIFIVCGPSAVTFPSPTHSASSLEEDKRMGPYWAQAFDGTDRDRPIFDGRMAHVTMREALALGVDFKILGGGGNPGRNRGRASGERRLSDLSDRPSTTIVAQRGGGAGNGGPFLVRPNWWHGASTPDHLSRSIGTRRNASVAWGSSMRRLSVSECAILQDFRVDHPFRGSETSIYKQIGNAVPRRLARKIMLAVKIADEAGAGNER